MAPFGFKKKNSQKEQPIDAVPAESLPAAELISIGQAQEILRRTESLMLSDVQRELQPIRDSALEVMASLQAIAEAMENEQIKLDETETRHKSVIENSRRAVASTLRRESSLELALPQSVNDVKKFRERMESMLSRFGEVSGSHSKLLNYFLKKQSGKMKHKFGELENLLKRARSVISDFDQRRAPLVRCSNLLNSAVQLAATSKASENAIKTAESDLAAIEGHAIQSKQELESITGSSEFPKSLEAVAKISEAEIKKQAHRERTAAQFSYISRILAKYSYGLGKEATARVQTMSEEPWRVFDSEMEPYLAILIELRKSVVEGKMQTKDSDKIASYVDSIVESLPQLKQIYLDLQEELKCAINNNDKTLAIRANEIQETLERQEEKLATGSQSIEQQRKQLAQRQEEIKKLLAEAEQFIANLSGSRHTIEV